MKLSLLLSALHLCLLLPLMAQQPSSRLLWGDQGNGSYRNPILCADYSDPDVIRVGEKYYMVASDFHFLGMQILESSDLVNWRLLTQLYHRFDFPGWDTNERYAGGSWAPSLRYHAGKFWVFFCTPHEGLFMTQAEHPEGPWTPLHQVRAVEKWEDPCPFWDEDGQAYLGRSQHGAGPIILHRMSADGRELLDEGTTIYTGPVAEGTKFLKRNGYYYLSIPEGGVGEGWQTVLRSKNIYGPYERRVVLEQGSTYVNGPHQGAIVDTPNGEWWFYHFQDFGPWGRVVHLQPMQWCDDWPVMGVDLDGNGIGEPVEEWQNPYGVSPETFLPQTSDDFSGPELSPQWQWNHNPVDSAWSLTEHPGTLTLHALQAPDFRSARNTLTQKMMGFDGKVTVCIDFADLAEGGRCGLGLMGKGTQLAGIMREGGKLYLYRGDTSIPEKKGDPEVFTEERRLEVTGTKVWLSLCLDFKGPALSFHVSLDGEKFSGPLDDPFIVLNAHWKGARVALYHYNTIEPKGAARISQFEYVVLE